MLNAITTSERVLEEYRRYLRSTFPLRNEALHREFTEALDTGFRLSKGPYLQASPPFEEGVTLAELVEEEVLCRGFSRLFSPVLPGERPLYQHQETAVRKAVGDRRNLAVATGTGSGKTECFLIPIFDQLLREAAAGTLEQPGTRALLLYPMNALANDQVKRLRSLLARTPEITFGRYVGETKSEPRKAESDFAARYPHEPRLPNELISREAMQAAPPHILLTNYAMLEYLLLRPLDSPLFDGPTGEHWRFVVLDEVHVYSGAQGTEVAMLLRRVRDRVCRSSRGRLQCFGTSATLGRGEEDYPALAAFATDLFDEEFEWTEYSARQDIVWASRKSLVRPAERRTFDPRVYVPLAEAHREGAGADRLADVASGFSGDLLPSPGDLTPSAYLAELLAGDDRVNRLQQRLEVGSMSVVDAAAELFGDVTATGALAALIELGVTARHRDDDAPLLPARYHFFLRAMEGAFACLHPAHPADDPRLRLNRHDECPVCAAEGRTATMFELGVCRRCGAEYLVGRIGSDHRLTSAPGNFSGLDYLLVLSRDEGGIDDEDQAAGQAEDPGLVEASWLACPGCGAVGREDVFACSCSPAPRPIPVVRASPAKGSDILRRCPSCSGRSGGEIVYRFLSGSEPPVAVIATNLYQGLGPAADRTLRAKVGQGRKLLVFSDSRQDAAFFAPYLERTYRRAVQRRLLADEIFDFGLDAKPRLADVASNVCRKAEDKLFLDPDAGRVTNMIQVNTWLMQELLALEPRQSLEGTGTAEVELVLPHDFQVPRKMLSLGFTAHEAVDLLRLLLDTLRLGGALTVPAGVDIRQDDFAPRNRQMFVRGEAPKTGVLAWIPGQGANRRLDLLTKVFSRKGINENPLSFLAQLWGYLAQKGEEWQKTLVSHDDRAHGRVWRLAHERFAFVPVAEGHLPFRCDTCGQISWRSVAAVCPQYQCAGTLQQVEDEARLLENHYARLYRRLEPLGMSVEEHTAQWVPNVAGEIQEKFVRGDINVLSCSTTFELGVDVGEVEAVLLRNVPPSAANYIQRAGRAGRRTEAAALVVTYAQRRSHDLTYFDDPLPMVDGHIAPPFILLENPSIVRRHLHSVAFALFERLFGVHRTVEDFFIGEELSRTPHEEFVDWLRSRPAELGEALGRIVPEATARELDVPEWGWVEALVEQDDENPTFGWLSRAGGEIRGDVEALDELIEEAAAAKKYSEAVRYQRVLQTLKRRRLLDYLATSNILPKYGFPVDVVGLNLVRSGDAKAADLDLSRDLKLAISEYAPGRETVAGKALWLSKGLGTMADRTWPSYAWAVCGECGAFNFNLGHGVEECRVCGSDDHAPKKAGTFIVPLFGFVGERSPNRPGESRPRSVSQIETFFGSYKDTEPGFERCDELRATLEYRSSKQGRVVIVNRGPKAMGFRVCEWCGYAAPAAAATSATRVAKEHDDLRRPGKKCRGTLRPVHLGHQYLTDVLEIRPGVPGEERAALSALYALLEGAVRLGVARKDIDGSLYRFSHHDPSALVLFDAVPGGAGNAQYLARRLPELVAAALRKVEECECGPETSCYSCLRSYGNQIWHDELSRGAAASLLRAMLAKDGSEGSGPHAGVPAGALRLDDLADADLAGQEATVVLETGFGAVETARFHFLGATDRLPEKDAFVILRHPGLKQGGVTVPIATGRWNWQEHRNAQTGEPLVLVTLRGVGSPVTLKLSAVEWHDFRPLAVRVD